MKKLSIRYSIVALLVISVFFTSSCGDLSAIRTFADSAKVVSQRFPGLAVDLYGSCVRTYRLHFYQVAKFEPIEITDIDMLSTWDQLESFPGRLSADGNRRTARDSERDCRQRWKKTEKTAAALNKVLLNYMSALGALASDELVSYKSSFDSLSKSVVKGGEFDEAKVSAGMGLARFLTEASTNFYRRKKLRDAIERENSNVQVLATALRRYGADGYYRVLRDERDEINKYFGQGIKQTRDPDRLTIMFGKAAWDVELKRIDEKIAAAHAFGKIMQDVAGAHQKLYNNRNDLNTKEMRTTLLEYAQEIHDLVETFKEAF